MNPSSMIELSDAQLDDVSGGKFFRDFLLGKALDYVIGAVSSGKVDYSNYVDTGASYGYWNGA